MAVERASKRRLDSGRPEKNSSIEMDDLVISAP
jgi:hypothetical protein